MWVQNLKSTKDRKRSLRKVFLAVSLVSLVFIIKGTDGRHISMKDRPRGERIHGDSVTVEAVDEGAALRSKIKAAYASSLHRNLKKVFQAQQSQTQNQYYKNLNQDEFLSGVSSRKNKPKVPKHQQSLPRPGSSFRHHLPFLSFPSYDNYNEDQDDEVDAEGDGVGLNFDFNPSGGDDEDPHFYQDRYKSSGATNSANGNKEVKEDDEESDENADTSKLSLANSYFDRDYSLTMLHSMECTTPTKSKGYCSTFKACVPSLFNSEGELEAPALAELVSMSIGYCTMDISGSVASNYLIKRAGQRYTAVANRIICCPGAPPAPGTSADDASAEKFNDFLAGSKPFLEEDGEDDKSQTNTKYSQSGSLTEKSAEYVDTDAEIWHSEEEFKVPKKPVHIIPIEAFIPPDKLSAYDPHTNTFSDEIYTSSKDKSQGNKNPGEVQENREKNKPSPLDEGLVQGSELLEPIKPESQSQPESQNQPESQSQPFGAVNLRPDSGIGGPMSDEFITNDEDTVQANSDDIEASTEIEIQGQGQDQPQPELSITIEPAVDSKEQETLPSDQEDEEKVAMIHGENSTFIKISPEPVIGANGKFTLEKGVHIEKATSETPRPKPNPAYQTQIGETTVNIIKAETTVDSNPIILLNSNTKQKPSVAVGESSESIDIVQLPTFSAKIPQPAPPLSDSGPGYEISSSDSDIQSDSLSLGETGAETDPVQVEPTTSAYNKYDVEEIRNSEGSSYPTTLQQGDDPIRTTTQKIAMQNDEDQHFQDENPTDTVPTTTGSLSYLQDGTVDLDEILSNTQIPVITSNKNFQQVPFPSSRTTPKPSNGDSTNTIPEDISTNSVQTTPYYPSDNTQDDENGYGLNDNQPENDHSESVGTTPAPEFQNDEDSTTFGATDEADATTLVPQLKVNSKQPIKFSKNKSKPSTNSGENSQNSQQNFVQKEPSYLAPPQFEELSSSHDSTEDSQSSVEQTQQKISEDKKTNTITKLAIETDLNRFGQGQGQSSKPAPQLFLDLAARPSPQIHEDDSLENEPHSSHPISLGGSSIETISQNSQNMEQTQDSSLSSEYSDSNEQISEEIKNSNKQQFPNKKVQTEIIINEQNNLIKSTLKPTPTPQVPTTFATVATTDSKAPGSSEMPSTEEGGVKPPGQPEYQILSACATQEYYRSLEQESSKQYPYLATIVGGSRPFCSGSLITERHILTAAHFLANITVADVFHMRVHVGYRAAFGGQTEGPFAVRKVLKVVRHKGFSFDKLLNDVAILLLDKPIRFSEDVHPVCLSNSPHQYANGGTEAFETGWVEDPLMKKISPHHPFIDPHIMKYFTFGYKNVTWNLQESSTRVRPKDDCQSNYAFLEKSGIAITDSMVCAATDDGKSCTFKGNSGAPLFIRSDDKPIQIGLVSWGIGCGHFPAVFTGVSSYLPWIEKVVQRTS